MLTAFNINAADSQQVLLCENVADPEKRGCTLIRTLLHLWVLSNNPGSTEGSMHVIFGIALASDDAFVGGALPDVEVDADYPVGGWLYRDSVLVTDMVANASMLRATELRADLRNQRKLERSSIYLEVANVLANGNSFVVRVSGIIRCLYKLP